MLNLLMREAHSVTDLAARLDTSVQRAHYLTGKLLEAEIAVVAGERRRAGPPVKLYHVPHPWFIPFSATNAETLEAFGNAQVLPRIEKIVQEAVQVFHEHTHGERGYWLTPNNLSMGDEQGVPQNLWQGDEPLLVNFSQVNIPREKATEFKRRLIALAGEYQAMSTPKEQAYTFALMLVRGEMDAP